MYTPMKKILCLFALFLMTACAPTPRDVSREVGRGRLSEAITLFLEIVNQDHELTPRELSQLLQAMAASRQFDLNAADRILTDLKPEAKRAVIRWYIQIYLESAEQRLQAEDFEGARIIWKRHQEVRQLNFPNFVEATPVMGIIDLRETEYLLANGKNAAAKQMYARARQRLTRRTPFDRVQQYAFERLVDDVTRKIQSVK